MYKILFIGLFTLLSIQLQAQKKLSEVLAANDFTAPDGTKKSLADIVKSHKGKIIHIDFWASWCGPFKREMPASIKLHDAFKDEEIVFLYLSIDDNEQAWLNAMEKLDIAKVGENWRRG